MESLEPNKEPGEIIWPKSSARQRLTVTGTRTENDPAFLTCNGICGKQQVKWTWHFKISSAQYKCGDCSNTRKWGLGFY